MNSDEFTAYFDPLRVRRRLGELGEEPRFSFPRLPMELPAGLRPAAVLIPLTEIDETMSAVFTMRPESMAEHSGEVSFPGGRAEENDDDLMQTALRETREEIALREEDVDLFGALVRMPTITGYDITTYVGEFSQPYALDPNPREIETLFTAPLCELANPECHRLETGTWQGMTFDLHFYEYGQFTIWGATGYMLHLLLEYLRDDD